MDLSHPIGLRVCIPLRGVKLEDRREFRFAGVQMKDVISSIVMQGSRRHRDERIAHAGKFTDGKNHLDDPSGLHIHSEVFHLAEFFVLIIIDRHSNDVGGPGRVVQPF